MQPFKSLKLFADEFLCDCTEFHDSRNRAVYAGSLYDHRHDPSDRSSSDSGPYGNDVISDPSGTAYTSDPAGIQAH